MIKFVKISVFDTSATTIVNTINCDGFMGAGLALEFSLRYPSLLQWYKKKCSLKAIHPGHVYLFQEKNISILNFSTKDKFQFHSKIEWIKEGLKDFVSKFSSWNITSIAFPRLGTKNGGLDWKIIKKLMIEYLEPISSQIDIYICEDEQIKLNSIEDKMIYFFNKVNIENFLNDISDVKLKLSAKQIEKLNNNKNIDRFWKIYKIPSIGSTTYEKIWQICFNFATENKYSSLLQNNNLSTPTQNLFE